MKPESRSTRGDAPSKFEAHDDQSPHDLMARRRNKSDQKLGKRERKIKAEKKKMYRRKKLLFDTVEEKLRKKQIETDRKKLCRQKG